MADPRRVERLEAEIHEIRKQLSVLMDHGELSAFIDHAKGELKDLKVGVDTVNGHVADVLSEIGTVPDHRYREQDRETITKRLHKLENDSNAARIAQTALKESRAAQEEARAAANEARRHAWSSWQKSALFIFAGIGTLLAVLNALGVG